MGATKPKHANGTTTSPPPGPDEKLCGAVEAILLSVDRAVAPSKIAAALALGDSEKGVEASSKQVEAAVAALNEAYEKSGRSFRIEKLAGGYRVMTLETFADAVAAFHASRAPSRLSRAAIETLSIVAYKQPITRAQLESIRGVACGEVLKTLLERRLVSIVGRAEELGRPILYGTSKRFLEEFGLSSLKELPSVGDFGGKASPKIAPKPEPAQGAPAGEPTPGQGG